MNAMLSRRTIISAIWVLLVALISGCGKSEPASATGAPAQAIDVARVLSQDVHARFTYTSRLESPKTVTLRPRVSGVVSSVEFKEGEQVRKGDVLFKLDNRTFLAEVKRLSAEVSGAKAALNNAEREAQRAKRMLETNAISTELAQSRQTRAQEAESRVMALEAALKNAELNLEFSSVTSPIDGRVSRADITEGNIVVANQTTLTRIVSEDSMYAYIDIDERTWNTHFSSESDIHAISVGLQRLGDSGFPLTGKLDFIDNQINQNTGTLRIRAVIPNQNGALRPGAFARVQLQSAQAKQAVLVPERAIGTDLENRFVLTINEDNTLEYTPVSLGEKRGEFRVIETGLNANMTIAVNGPARVRPGMKISPRNTPLIAEPSLSQRNPNS